MAFAWAVEKWRPWVDRVQQLDLDPFPADLVLKWFELESGGNECSQGFAGKEAGLAQTYFDTPSTVKFGVTFDVLRRKCSGGTRTQDLTDDDRLLHARVGVATCKEARGKARAKLSAVGVAWSESSFDFWAFVKLDHALPAVYAMLGPAKKAGAAGSWSDFRGYVLADQARLSQYMNRTVANVAHWMDTCEEFASTSYDPPSRWKLWALFGGVLALFGLSRVRG